MTHKLEIVYGLFAEFTRLEMSGQITAIGILGETCRIAAPPPIMLPALAFYAYVRNPEHLALNAKIQITLPGNPTPMEFNTPIKADTSQDGHNLNINMMSLPIPGPGVVVAKIHLDTTPPVEREFRLRLDFQPGANAQSPKPILMTLGNV